MMLRIKLFGSLLLLSLLNASAQKLNKNDKITLTNLEAHIHYLADDKLEGRRTGTAGEKAASDYIISELSKTGVQPKGDNNGWLQAFLIDQGREISPDTHFSANDKALVLYHEYFPLTLSAIGQVTGSPAIALQESGEPWFLDLRELLEAGAGSPHFNLPGAIRTKAAAVAKKGATALIVYNSSKIPDNLAFDPQEQNPVAAAIPVVYITAAAKRKYLRDESASVDIKIKVGFAERQRTGHNVVAYLNNGAATTVIIGAHYDHLGHGEDSNTLYRGPGPVTFNGANDNASGVAGMIELARLLAASKLRNNNYLFIAFSGKELSLSGSWHFADHLGADLNKVNYMINMDMIGRLNDTTHALTVGGYGSTGWESIFNVARDKKLFSFRFEDVNAGSGDHSSFYRQRIPVLFISTGIAADYHTPDDNYDKINYPGEVAVLKFVYEVIEGANDRGKLSFTGTKTGADIR
jgi:aminopeptidase YwaD